MVIRAVTETRQLFGRKQIFTDSEEITAANVVEVLKSALRVHSQNQDEIRYLWDYYRGITPKMLCLPEGVDAKYLSAAMQQTDMQVLVDNLYDAVLTICGIPNRNGGSSTSDTGSAVIMRDGWESAEAQMKSVEHEFKKAEKRFLKLILRILKDTPDVEMNLELRNVEIKFSRRNYDNLQTKSQVLTTLLNNPKIHPELAFVHSGLFLDPESAYLQSKEWWEQQEQKEQQELNSYVDSLTDPNTDEPAEDESEELDDAV